MLRPEFDRFGVDRHGRLALIKRSAYSVIHKLQEACLSLRGDFDAQIAWDLDTVLSEIDHHVKALWHRLPLTTTPEFRAATSGLLAERRWEKLSDLADHALCATHPLRPILDFGATLGDYELALGVFRTEPGTSTNLEAAPDIRPLVLRVRELPESVIQNCFLFDAMVRFAPQLESHGQVTYLRLLHLLNRDVFRTDISDADPNFLPWTIAQIVGLSDHALCKETLENLSTEKPRPTWTPGGRELRIGDVVVRVVAGQARNLRTILDACEASAWSPRIADPLRRPNGFRSGCLNQDLNSLNHGLTKIRFKAGGGGSWIEWVWTEL